MRATPLLTRLRLLFLIMLVVCLAAAALSLWSVRQSQYHLTRVHLAHSSYEEHLSLSNNTYQLFKQYGDALIIGDLDEGAGEQALIGVIRGNVAAIRDLVGQEIELIGEEEVEELGLLAEIEFKIETLIRSFETVLNGGPTNSFSDDWQRLSHMLDAEIDRDFRALIDEALTGEAAEVQEARGETRRLFRMLQFLAAAAAAVSLFAAAFSLWTIQVRIKAPIQRLLHGVRVFGDGEMGYRIRLAGRDELSEIASTFDAMADRVSAEAAQLADENTELEAAVAERTSQLEQLLAEARRAEATRRRLLSDVSHELRTPLTIIKGEADVALRVADNLPEVYRQALGRTRDAAVHTARLVDDLLFVARSEEGHARLKPEDFDLADLVTTTAAAFNPDLAVEAGSAPALIRGDPGRIAQALLVLLENARHHGGTTVLVRLAATPSGWSVAVEDNGPGMNEDEKRNAFARFYRGPNAASRYTLGVGLGLPVARAIAEAHGGSVTLEDRPGGGLIARLVLPRRMQLKAVK